MSDAPVVAIIVTKRNPLRSVGRAQKYRWKAVNWGNHKTLATSSEAYTNRTDALAAAVQLFGDDTTDGELLEQAGIVLLRPANVFLIQDGVSGMQALRVQAAS